MSIDVSIIIVNYNTKQLLSDCLTSIYRETVDVSFEIIVADNASSDGSKDFIRAKFPEVVWLDCGKNLGFGCANNLGAKHAKGEYLFLLNSDTILKNNALYLFKEYMKARTDEKIGILGGWLLDSRERPNNSFGFFPTPKSEIMYLFKKVKNVYPVSLRDSLDVDYITGADIFILKDLFCQLDGFDENIFMYYEETDLQYRMAALGFIRRVIPEPRIIHLEGGSFDNKGLTFNRFMMSQRSYNYYLKKHFCGFRYLYYRTVLLFVRLTLFFTTNWRLHDKIKAYLLVLKGS